MKASIIVGSYNHKDYTIECIESCLNLDYTDDYEIIIVDDGSNDGSIEMIDQYAKRYPDKIKYAVMDRNDGVDILFMRSSHVREKGLSMSTGEYILLLDGDDLITKDKLSLQISFLETHKEYIACFTDFDMFWDNGKKQIIRFNYSTIGSSMYWGNGVYMHSSSFVFRREVMKNFIHSVVVDNPATFSILSTGRVYHIPVETFHYRQREGSIIHSFNSLEKKIREVLIFQYLFNSGRLKCACLARWKGSICAVFKNRKGLQEDCYKKYYRVSQNIGRDYLAEMRDYDSLSLSKKISLRMMMLGSKFFWVYYRSLRVIMIAIKKKPLTTIIDVEPK